MARIVGYDVSSPELLNTGRSEFLGSDTRCRCMEIPGYVLEKLLLNACELGAINALIQTGQLKPYLNKSEAYQTFGRRQVSRWIESGLVQRRKDGNHSASWRLDRMELEIASRSHDLLSGMYGASNND